MDALATYLPSGSLAGGGAVASAATARPMSFAEGPLKTATAAQRARAEKTARDFEASFLSSAFGQMFEGTEVSEPFGGGTGESAFRSFMTDAFGKSLAARGGVGLSRSVAAEMLKLQGLK